MWLQKSAGVYITEHGIYAKAFRRLARGLWMILVGILLVFVTLGSLGLTSLIKAEGLKTE